MNGENIEQSGLAEGKTEGKEGGPQTDLAEGVELDPRFSEIKNELIKDWEKTNAPKDIYSAEGQDFLFGDPTASQRGEEPVTLEQRVRGAFTDRFPEDAAAYGEKEKTRIYDDPRRDPAVKSAEKGIVEMTAARYEHGVRFGQKEGTELWRQDSAYASMERWKTFVMSYPEKAAAYKDKFGPIKDALERKEQQKERSETRNPGVHRPHEDATKARLDRLFGPVKSESAQPGSEGNPEYAALQEQFLLRNIGARYDDVFGVQENVARLQEEMAEGKRHLEELRQSAGIPPRELATASGKRLEAEQKRLEQENQTLLLLERRYLDLPPEEETRGESRREEGRAAMGRHIERRAEKLKSLQKEVEEKLRKERENFVRSFIESATKEAITKLSDVFRKSENGEKAKKLFALKIWHAVMNNEKEWIETGEIRGKSIGLTYVVEFQQYAPPGFKKERQYVTNIKIEMMGEEERAEMRELLKEQERTALRQKESEGGTKKKEKKG